MALAGLAILGVRYRTMQDEVRRLHAEVASAARRERALEATVARQHQALQVTEGDLETLRFQMEAVELQLDGLDFLSQQLRSALGLPPGEATWSGAASAPEPQGGAGAPLSVDRDRLTRAQRRAASGLSELLALSEVLRTRAAPAAPSSLPDARAIEAAVPANWPARGVVTSDFGWRVFRALPNFHSGIDVALDYGSQVLATADGIVLGSGWQPGYGWSVLLQHGRGYCTLYAHLSASRVAVGDRIRVGDVIALSGSSGNSTGPHLHYEIWQDGMVLDPRPFMDGTPGH